MKYIRQKLKLFFKLLAFKLLPRSIIFKGPYENWNSLEENNSYDSSKLNDRLFSQAQKVWDGKAKYERDGFIFNEIQRSWQVSFSFSIINNHNKADYLNVLDFGGAYGSSYIENAFLEDLLNLKLMWNIVELPSISKLGSENFQTKSFKFYDDINKIDSHINVVLFGSSIQYIQDPYHLLTNILKKFSPGYLIFDRTGFSSKSNDEIFLQKVNMEYKASYPAWILSHAKFLNFFKDNNYEVLFDWDSIQIPHSNQKYKGLLLKKC